MSNDYIWNFTLDHEYLKNCQYDILTSLQRQIYREMNLTPAEQEEERLAKAAPTPIILENDL